MINADHTVSSLLLEIHHSVFLDSDVVGTVDVVMVVCYGECWTANCAHGAVEESTACCKGMHITLISVQFFFCLKTT